MEVEDKKLSPFDFINNINADYRSSLNLLDDCQADTDDGNDMSSSAKSYNAFMVNRGLSYFNDTVLYANEMNMRSDLAVKMQYDFLRIGIRARKRFSKWSKQEISSDVKLCMEAYGYNYHLACSAVAALGPEGIAWLRAKHDHGGLKKSNK